MEENESNILNNNISKICNIDQEKLLELENENLQLKNKIKELENKLNLEKENNKILIENYNNLKIVSKEKEKIFNEKINRLKIYSNVEKILELIDELKSKEKESNELKLKIPFELSSKEKLMSVIFYSTNQQIHCSFICKNTLKFSALESLLYDIEEYKKYKNLENIFIVKGKKINRFETLEENGIKDKDIILIDLQDF